MVVRGAWVLLAVLGSLACGQSERNTSERSDGDSGGSAGAGRGGAAGNTSGGAGSGAGGAVGSGGVPLPPLHDCATVENEPACPERVLVASILGNDDDPPLEMLDGVTDLTGELVVFDDNREVLDHLGCLRRVGGEIHVDSDETTSLWGLRNVEEVAYEIAGNGIRLRGDKLRQDCGLLRVRSMGPSDLEFSAESIDVEFTKMSEFALPLLERVASVRIQDNPELERVLLPEALEFFSGQFWVMENPRLSSIPALETIVLRNPRSSSGSLAQYRFVDNPLFPNCNFETFQAHLVAQGADSAAFEISGNLPACGR